MAQIEIYLGKGGQTFGPYTVEQFETLQAKPDFSTYTYIWDGRDQKPDWKPIEEAPAPVQLQKNGPGAPPPDQRPEKQATEQPPLAQVIPITSKTARPKLQYDAPSIEAVCHDSRTVVSGRLSKITDGGCELLSADNQSEQGFGSSSNVILNLLDSENGKSMSVAARLDGFRRENGQWSYRVLWSECPSLIVGKISHKLEKSG